MANTVGSTILKPDIRFQYLNRRVPEKVTYLQIPHITSLDKDIKKGAVQYKEIRDYLKKESSSNYIVISTDNKEHGYMAIMYLESEFQQRRHLKVSEARLKNKESEGEQEEDIDYDMFEMMEEERFSDEADYYFDEECYCEDSFQIPIIHMSELNQYVNKSKGNCIFGGLPMQWDQDQHNIRPYWADCKKGAVCILCENQIFGGYGMELDEGTTDSLSFFEKNKRVYILFVDRQMDEQSFDEEELPFVNNDFSGGNALKNEVVLNYTADELQVYLPEEYKKAYYKHLLRGFFENYNITVKKGFSYDKIVNLILSMTRTNICQRMDKIVKYAIKDKNKTAPIQLVNEDFKFMDKFTRTDAWGKKSKGKARDRLNNELIGMEHIKEKVYRTVDVMKFNRMRDKMNIRGGQYHNVHVMLGAPGTAKTTVAELMGQIMVEEKLLPDNRFICVNGAELKGMYVGHSAPKTKALFDNYDIIVIDEAYSLVDDGGNTDSFSKEAIAQMIIELEKHSTDKLVIFAGYGGKNISDKNNKMRAFMEANPGIKSRITSTFHFDSYSPEEMVQIFYRIAKLQKYIVAPEAGKELAEYFKTRVSADNFGNGREARSLLETTVVYTAERVFANQKTKYSKQEMQQITVEDIKAAICEAKHANQIQNAEKHRNIGFCS